MLGDFFTYHLEDFKKIAIEKNVEFIDFHIFYDVKACFEEEEIGHFKINSLKIDFDLTLAEILGELKHVEKLIYDDIMAEYGDKNFEIWVFIEFKFEVQYSV